ncbi:hypothetical protein [Persicobacter diffluens]|uniref:Uncharacterized protein n=1 Tax=Persicobacter diffluens TaxID=981 RepID=A0AAN4W138_9BACT|nr:hypothetical protein PEDI_31170 [Persicobacter diffluens]
MKDYSQKTLEAPFELCSDQLGKLDFQMIAPIQALNLPETQLAAKLSSQIIKIGGLIPQAREHFSVVFTAQENEEASKDYYIVCYSAEGTCLKTMKIDIGKEEDCSFFSAIIKDNRIEVMQKNRCYTSSVIIEKYRL